MAGHDQVHLFTNGTQYLGSIPPGISLRHVFIVRLQANPLLRCSYVTDVPCWSTWTSSRCWPFLAESASQWAPGAGLRWRMLFTARHRAAIHIANEGVTVPVPSNGMA